jgi:hypothetical protein
MGIILTPVAAMISCTDAAVWTLCYSHNKKPVQGLENNQVLGQSLLGTVLTVLLPVFLNFRGNSSHNVSGSFCHHGR